VLKAERAKQSSESLGYKQLSREEERRNQLRELEQLAQDQQQLIQHIQQELGQMNKYVRGLNKDDTLTLYLPLFLLACFVLAGMLYLVFFSEE
jgi:seryl-tRNA synthetase